MNCPGSNTNARPSGEWKKKLFTSCVSCLTWQHTSVSSTSLVQRSGSALQNAGRVTRLSAGSNWTASRIISISASFACAYAPTCSASRRIYQAENFSTRPSVNGE